MLAKLRSLWRNLRHREQVDRELGEELAGRGLAVLPRVGCCAVMYMRVRGEGGTLFPKGRCVVSFDGTHIAYGLMGRGDITVALCAGYCCPDNFWKYLTPALAKRYRVLIWNYRGCGVSGMPREPGYRARNYTVEDFSLDRYARDLKAILDHEGIRRVVLLGHSMGTQVCRNSQARRWVPGWKRWENRKARRYVSWTRSSASGGFRVRYIAKL